VVNECQLTDYKRGFVERCSVAAAIDPGSFTGRGTVRHMATDPCFGDQLRLQPSGRLHRPRQHQAAGDDQCPAHPGLVTPRAACQSARKPMRRLFAGSGGGVINCRMASKTSWNCSSCWPSFRSSSSSLREIGDSLRKHQNSKHLQRNASAISIRGNPSNPRSSAFYSLPLRRGRLSGRAFQGSSGQACLG
jgi:hypothetical protein